MKRILIIFSFLSLLALPAATAFGQTETPTPEQIKERVTIRRPYRIGEEAEVALPIGQAVQFDCADNPYWVNEYLLYAATNNQIWVCPLDAEGDQINTGGTSFQKKQGCLRQVADGPCLAIMKWSLQDQILRLHFCLSVDKERNQREWEASTGASTMARWKNNFRAFPQQKLPEAERLAGFARLWSEVKYNFALFDRVPEVDWDKVLLEYIPKVQQAETLDEYCLVLERSLALLHDGHTGVSGGLYTHRLTPLPFEVRRLTSGQVVITRIVPPLEVRNSKRKDEITRAALKPGEELTHIDGQMVADILEREIYPQVCASTPQGRDLLACWWLLGGDYGSTATLRIRGLDGTEREVTLSRANYPSSKPKGFESCEAQDGILYVNLPRFESKEVVKDFEKVFPRLQKARGLILDVRHNEGGNDENVDSIISMLTDKPINGLRWKTRQYMPAFRALGKEQQWHEEEDDPVKPSRKDPFLGPVVVLTGPETFSAAEDFVVLLHASKRATVVGERTNGSTGQPLMIDLPAAVKARICTIHNTYPDGREFVGVGVIPDVEVHPTAVDIATDRDVVLEKGIALLKAACAPKSSGKL
jgi:C-terminal processing protease CtpA/Prc